MDSNTQRSRRKVLLVEDDPSIGMMVADDLDEVGYEVLGPFTSCTETIAWLDGHDVDAAVLDVHLTDGVCIELARALRDKNVPFIVLSGYSSNSSVADGFAGVPWIEKPCSAETIWERLDDVLGTRSRHSAQ